MIYLVKTANREGPPKMVCFCLNPEYEKRAEARFCEGRGACLWALTPPRFFYFFSGGLL